MIVEDAPSLLHPVIIHHGNTVDVRLSTESERAEYTSLLVGAVNLLNDTIGKDGWWMIGGISRDALLENRDFVVKDPKGNWRDIDILVREDKRDRLARFHERYNGPIPIGGGALQSCIRVLPDKVVLQYGGVREEVPIKTFDSTSACLGSVRFPTVPLATLFHLYAVGDRPNGRMREKDFLNALVTGRYLMYHSDPDHPEELYQGFHTFSRRKNNLDEVGLAHKLRQGAIWYKESWLNHIFPIDKPWIKPIIEHVWRTIGDFQVDRAKNDQRTPIVNTPIPINSDAQPDRTG